MSSLGMGMGMPPPPPLAPKPKTGMIILTSLLFVTGTGVAMYILSGKTKKPKLPPENLPKIFAIVPTVSSDTHPVYGSCNVVIEKDKIFISKDSESPRSDDIFIISSTITKPILSADFFSISFWIRIESSIVDSNNSGNLNMFKAFSKLTSDESNYQTIQNDKSNTVGISKMKGESKFEIKFPGTGPNKKHFDENTWQHIVITKKFIDSTSSEYSIYINGSNFRSTTIKNTDMNPNWLYFNNIRGGVQFKDLRICTNPTQVDATKIKTQYEEESKVESFIPF